MSLPVFSTQAELFSTASLTASLFPPTDRYRLFAQKVYPKLAAARPALAACYCVANGRVALEPVLLLGVSILQYLDGVPDRQALDLLRYHVGWNFALNRQLGDAVFHPTSLVNFRQRLLEHDQSALGFQTVLEALVAAGLVTRHSRQRLDSTQMLGRVARMNRLDCVRESLRLALQELAAVCPAESRPGGWVGLWERYVDSQVDYRTSAETLGRKLAEAGTDAWQLVQWLGSPEAKAWATGPQVQLLRRVFGEQFEVVTGQPAPRSQEPVTDVAGAVTPEPKPAAAPTEAPPDVPPPPAAASVPAALGANGQLELSAAVGAAAIQPKGKGQLSADRVQNPHDPDATYAVKGQGQQKKEHVGYKVQVAESVSEAVLAPGEPTRNFLTGIVTQQAHHSDEAGAEQMTQEQAAMGLEKPPVQYVDGAYISAQQLVQAQAEGRELIGPAQPAPRKDGRFCVEDFQVTVEARRAVCPAGHPSTQCSRLEEQATGKISFRFEWSTHCHACPLRSQCLAADQRHRTLVVGEHHTALQARRQEQQTAAFQQRMKHRNGIEGTQSELVRAHGLRRARDRGLGKVRLQNYLLGAACNVKRWLRREIWQLRQAAAATTTAAAVASAA